MIREGQEYQPMEGQMSPELRPDVLSMNEMAVRAFLAEQGIKPLDNWQPGQPVLYLFDDGQRADGGPFTRIPIADRPNLAIVRNPTSLDLPPSNKPDMKGYLRNAGGKADFYVIDPQTRYPRFLWSESKTKSYLVRDGYLFTSSDELFPSPPKQ